MKLLRISPRGVPEAARPPALQTHTRGASSLVDLTAIRCGEREIIPDDYPVRSAEITPHQLKFPFANGVKRAWSASRLPFEISQEVGI
jgi:hypothetical protein